MAPEHRTTVVRETYAHASPLRAFVADGSVPGLLANRAGEAIGWVAVSPRSELIRLDTGVCAHFRK